MRGSWTRQTKAPSKIDTSMLVEVQILQNSHPCLHLFASYLLALDLPEKDFVTY